MFVAAWSNLTACRPDSSSDRPARPVLISSYPSPLISLLLRLPCVVFHFLDAAALIKRLSPLSVAMADAVDLAGVMGTWVAVFLAIVALLGLLPAYILYRRSRTEKAQALSHLWMTQAICSPLLSVSSVPWSVTQFECQTSDTHLTFTLSRKHTSQTPI